jgi:hypothetical protein
MRLSPLLLVLALVALAAVLVLGPCRQDRTPRQVAADSLAARADSIAREAADSLAADSLASEAADSSIEAGDAIVGGLADTLKDLDRVEADLRRRGAARAAVAAVALDTAPAPTGADPEAAAYRHPEWKPCALSDEACSDSVEAVSDTTTPPPPVAATSADSLAWYRALDANSTRQKDNLRRQVATLTAQRDTAKADRERWRRRALILGRQVEDLRATTNSAAKLVEPPTLDLGIVKIPRPCVGAGPGGTIGLASNGQGTGFGGAVGLTVAVVIPFSGGCGA